MLSILIPTYQYNAYPLAEVIERQALVLDIKFELLCRDDGSFSEHNKANQQINTLSHCKFIEGKSNLGSIGNRLWLAQAAQYDWLLFIDADTLPMTGNFLGTYIQYVTGSYDAIFGGFAYEDFPVSDNRTLRHNFGKQREEMSSVIRNKKPYKIIISSNFLMKKTAFINILEHFDGNNYGLDYLFGALLKQSNVKILHIDNEVLHLGIDNNTAYLHKIRRAVQTLLKLHLDKQIRTHEISLLKAYQLTSSFGMKGFMRLVYNTYHKSIEKNLVGKKPSLRLLDLYKLSYMCSIRP